MPSLPNRARTPAASQPCRRTGSAAEEFAPQTDDNTAPEAPSDEAWLREASRVFSSNAAAESSPAAPEKRIDMAGLKKALEIKSDYFARKIFSIFDEENQGYLTEAQFIRAVEKLLRGDRDEKLRFAFRLHDADGDGALSREDLSQYLQASSQESRLNFRSDQVEQLLITLLFSQTRKEDEAVPFPAFKRILQHYPKVDEQLTLGAVAWLQPRPEAHKHALPNLKQHYREAKRYIDNNRAKVACLTIYIGINIFLFSRAFIQYGHAGANIYVQIARGCGACLNLNGALILLPMLRHTLTWLKATRLRHVIPLDQNIAFHRLIGLVMFALSMVHTIAHLLNYSTLQKPLSHSLFLTQAGLTGVLLLVVFALMAYFESRRRMHFELFYFSHLAFVLWFVLALLHGPVFWKWALLPIIAYGIERWIRFRRTTQPSIIQKAVIFPSRVSNLQIARPAGFYYRPGDYLFIRIPAISRFEWHPFTISSSPEDKTMVSVHIRNCGNWTHALYEYFLHQDIHPEKANTPVFLDGPYGTPSSHGMESEIAILIGAGIGVTPCASILQSILHQHQSHSGFGGNLKKVHFFWLNRDQQSFEWFAELLRQLEEQDIEDFLDINIYMTGARPDMKSSTLNIALHMLHRRLNVDLVTGLQARTRMGHPKWEDIFTKLARRYRNQKVDVYFCGPPGLSTVLKRNAHRVGFGYHKENF